MTNPTQRQNQVTVTTQLQVLEGEMLRLEEISRLCRMSPDWVLARVQEEVLEGQYRDGTYYFSSATIWRACQVADLEVHYDADPQLAALVADLSEEIQALRARLRLLDT
ncbi:MerR family transcriptional regulator [Orrella sp. 11846]|uniref:MerR family transcriptional regulator n=1 Tax=Orrella sp. 11846 TaxID=3409913 RepID=UPI003B5CE130